MLGHNLSIIRTVMGDESTVMSAKTWARAADSLNKVGYMDGAADGQAASFQFSFDKGYSLGFSSGFQLGTKHALHSLQVSTNTLGNQLQDTRKINCQICLDNKLAQQSINNLYNSQKEKNDELFSVQNNEIG